MCSSDLKAESDTIRYRKKGVNLPFQQHCITFEKITYAVDMPQVNLKYIIELEINQKLESLFLK